MKIFRDLQNLFTSKQKKDSHEREIRKYAKDGIKTYKKTLRKLAHE